MALSWNEIKDRAIRFSKEWENEASESAEAKTFWDGFFHIFGMTRRRLASFEQAVKKFGGKQGFIDLFWKGTLLVEHKSRGKDLDKAFQQAIDYFPGLKENELPKYILVSDFARFRLYDLEEGTENEFPLKDLYKHIKLFGFIAGYQKRSYKEEDPVNIEAAEQMGKLDDKLQEVGYEGHALEVYLVRLLFCMFADDTTIFERDTFVDYLETKTKEDGSDLAAHLSQIFHALNTPKGKRLKNLDYHLNQFPFVNGKLFAETLPPAAFDSEMRQDLIDACYLNWGKISPAIFGSLFQSVMNPKERRNSGAHYTSEKNILKLIKPLFLDQLWEEFGKVKGSSKKLTEFHTKIGSLTFLDPACGCGNFLVITYRELRLLEIAILKALHTSGQGFLDVSTILRTSIENFYGIEIDEWPARIAEVAMWLMDHQMNMQVSEEFGQYFVRLPLDQSANIRNANALQLDWEVLVSKDELDYIIGNPPFIGHHYQSAEQKQDLKNIFEGRKSIGVLDFVSAWFYQSSKFIQNTRIQVALVSTNSISQGEQVGILWKPLLKDFNIKIHYAHRTFRWDNEAKGKAAVHVVIIGFANYDIDKKLLFEYDDIKGDPQVIKVKNINPYLVDSIDVVLSNRPVPIAKVPKMIWGNKPTDGGNFLFGNSMEKNEFLQYEPKAEKWIRPYLSGRDLIHDKRRFCLWLEGINPKELRELPMVMKRVEAVRDMRLASKAKATRKKALIPTRFAQISQPDTVFLAIPEVSSERRNYIPIAYLEPDIIASNTIQLLPNANNYLFGVITSVMHMTWMKYTCGRLKSDYRYSNSIVYNNFPWPRNPKNNQITKVEEKAQAVLDARSLYPDSSLADLYDPLLMPPELVKAHQALDKAVDLCYRPQPFPDERRRIEFLFELYAEYTEPLLLEGKKAKK
jgi:hypothetical protein